MFNKPNFNAYAASTLDIMNNQIGNIMLATANINNMNLKIDVDMFNEIADNIVADFIGANNSIFLSQIFVLNDINTSWTFAIDPLNKFNLMLADSANIASGLNYNYNVANNFNGSITLTPFSTPVPEPSSIIFGLMSIAGALGLRKRNKKA